MKIEDIDINEFLKESAELAFSPDLPDDPPDLAKFKKRLREILERPAIKFEIPDAEKL